MMQSAKPTTDRSTSGIDPRAQAEAFQKAFNAHDVNGLLNLFAEDAQVIWPGQGQEVSGKAAIEKMIRGMFDRFPNAHATFKFQQAMPLGNGYVASIGRWEESFMTPDGKPATVEVRTTELLRKEGNKTVYAVDHASLGMPETK